jgi:type II secretory ATPase GspE/PulE/Tfp pilus assembly ATPase PilB-like protein
VRYKPSAEELRRLGLKPEQVKHLYRPPEPGEGQQLAPGEEPKVCEHCGGVGYHGRTGLFELLVLNDPIRELVRQGLNLDAIRQQAIKDGTILLQADGVRKVVEGQTSIEELLRVSK